MTLPLPEGTLINSEYRVLRPLGQGGMGAVFVAEQLTTGRLRALKVMNGALLSNPQARERFALEARVGSRIESEHVVEVVGAGFDRELDVPWIAMELLTGATLADVLARVGALSPAETLDVFRQLCHGLALAHKADVVHRDLKPANIFLERPRRAGAPFTVKLLDFGIAKLLSDGGGTATESIGTPYWMAPEQTDPSPHITPAVDVWALGLIAFRMLYGKNYWRSSPDAVASVVREVVLAPIVPASVRAAEYGLTVTLPHFDDWFASTVVRDRTRRFADAEVALRALERALGQAAVGPLRDLLELASAATDPVSGLEATALAPPGPPLPPAMPALASAPHEPPTGPRRGHPEQDVQLEAASVTPTLSAPAQQRLPQSTSRQSRGGRWIAAVALVGASLLALAAFRFARFSRTPFGHDPLLHGGSAAIGAAPAVPSSASRTVPLPSAPDAVTQAKGSVLSVPALAASGFYRTSFMAFRPVAPDGTLDTRPRTFDAASQACQKQKRGMVCTRSQWNALCDTHPVVGTHDTWTLDVTDDGKWVTRGGGSSCRSQSAHATGDHGASILCCTPSVELEGEYAFVIRAWGVLVAMQSMIVSGDTVMFGTIVVPPVDFFAKKRAKADEVAQELSSMLTGGKYFAFERCRELGGQDAATCRRLAYGDQRISVHSTRVGFKNATLFRSFTDERTVVSTTR